MRFFCVVGLFIVSAVSLLAEEKLFLVRGDDLLVLDSVNGQELDRRPVSGASLLVPTPGGKYVFILNGTTGLGWAVDFDDPGNSGKAKPVDVSDWAPVVEMDFSPMGHEVFFTTAGGDVIAFDHRAGVVSSGRRLDLPSSSSGSVAVNTRGTRLYRQDGRELVYFLNSDLSRIKSVGDTGDVKVWEMAPGGRQLWGWSGDAIVVVDEPRGKVVKSFDLVTGEEPVFSPDGLTAWVFSDNGPVLIDVRRRRIIGEWSLGATGLDGNVSKVSAPAPVSGRKAWFASKDDSGRIVLVDSELDSAADVVVLGGEGDVTHFASVTLKSGQGFACF